MRNTRTTRRDFLKASTGLGAAAAIAPAICSAAPARVKSANDRINVLAIGVRGRGGGVALAAAKFASIAGVCDVDTASVDLFREKLSKQQQGRPDIYHDYRKALERKDIEIVTIGTPDHWHTPILIAALKAGKDVYCEKPLTLTIDEGKKICQAVQETGRVVQVGTQQRSEFGQRFLKAVAIARGGQLGKRLTATCFIGPGRAGGPFPVLDPPGTLDWDFWLGPAPMVPFTKERCHGTFRWWFDYSGGKMTDWGAHHIDIAQWALGAENSGPVEISGEGELPLGQRRTLELVQGKMAPTKVPNVYNTSTTFKIEMKLANGNRLIVQDGPGNGIKIAGEKDFIFVSRKELTGPLIDRIAAGERETSRLDQEVLKLYHGQQPTTHMENFIRAVRGESRPISDVFTSHRSITTCHLCNIALLLGRKLRWDPKGQNFKGDAEADGLLIREQRKDFLIES